MRDSRQFQERGHDIHNGGEGSEDCTILLGLAEAGIVKYCFRVSEIWVIKYVDRHLCLLIGTLIPPSVLLPWVMEFSKRKQVKPPGKLQVEVGHLRLHFVQPRWGRRGLRPLSTRRQRHSTQVQSCFRKGGKLTSVPYQAKEL